MPKLLLPCALAAVLCLAVGCEKNDVAVEGITDCAPTNKVVKTLTNAAGVVSFDQSQQQYTILVHQPGTIDVVDIGVVCGTLPASLQAAGTRVLVSGTFKEYDKAPTTPVFAGSTYYYLAITQLSPR